VSACFALYRAWRSAAFDLVAGCGDCALPRRQQLPHDRTHFQDRKAQGQVRPQQGPCTQQRDHAGAATASWSRRPTIYTKELGTEICELVAMRVPLIHICQMPGMPCEKTIYTWKRLHPEFSQEYARAREHRADARADRIDEIAEELRTGKLDAPTARTLFDVERWQAGREKPAVYGDRIDARLADANGEPLQIQATVAVRALLEAMPELMNGKLIDALPVAEPALPPLPDREAP
jgi:hypothetical protein